MGFSHLKFYNNRKTVCNISWTLPMAVFEENGTQALWKKKDAPSTYNELISKTLYLASYSSFGHLQFRSFFISFQRSTTLKDFVPSIVILQQRLSPPKEELKKSGEAFREQNLMIFPFLSFLIQTVYIPPIVG